MTDHTTPHEEEGDWGERILNDLSNPKRMGAYMAELVLGGFLDDLISSSRDIVFDHLDMQFDPEGRGLPEGVESVFDSILKGYEERATEMLRIIDNLDEPLFKFTEDEEETDGV